MNGIGRRMERGRGRLRRVREDDDSFGAGWHEVTLVATYNGGGGGVIQSSNLGRAAIFN